MINIEKELQRLLLLNREHTSDNMPGACDSYNREMAFYDTVASGNVDMVEMLYSHPTALKMKVGTLSNDAVNNQRYHTIITIALVSRFCIQAGLDITVSYTISDIYIRMADSAKSVDELISIQRNAVRDYCKRMRDIKKKNVISKHIVIAIEYIREHIQENLTIDTIADALELNPSYLSKLFKQEMQISISQYIREEKIKIACDMLRHLNVSSLDIANYLGFSSQSHFIQVFKKQTGYTPEEFRKIHYHKSWMGEEEGKSTAEVFANYKFEPKD